MKKIVIIPARYGSSRLPGKPLIDICGKPMIWWVYKHTKEVKGIDDVYVATDDDRIKEVCDKYEMNVVMTSTIHKTHVDRLHEVSNKIDADMYICVCGDEPLIEAKTIEKIIPNERINEEYYVSALMREFSEPTEVIEPGNIKVVTNNEGYCTALSRSPIPFPYKTILYKYKKTLGIECYNKKALDYFVNTPEGIWEKIESVTLMRFLENHIKVKFTLVDDNTISVDTEKDVEKVRKMIEAQQK